MEPGKLGIDLETGEIDYCYHKAVLNQFAAVPEEEWRYLRSLLTVRYYSRGKHLLQEGERCNSLFYIVKGSVRCYYVNKGGEELSYNFVFENSFAIGFSSVFEGTLSEENFVLMEETVVLVLDVRHFHNLLKRHPVWEVILNRLITKHFIKACEKEKLLLLEKPDDRFKRLLETCPHIFQRVEQRYIASYLNMTPETLSRVKKRTRFNRK